MSATPNSRPNWRLLAAVVAISCAYVPMKPDPPPAQTAQPGVTVALDALTLTLPVTVTTPGPSLDATTMNTFAGALAEHGVLCIPNPTQTDIPALAGRLRGRPAVSAEHAARALLSPRAHLSIQETEPLPRAKSAHEVPGATNETPVPLRPERPQHALLAHITLPDDGLIGGVRRVSSATLLLAVRALAASVGEALRPMRYRRRVLAAEGPVLVFETGLRGRPVTQATGTDSTGRRCRVVGGAEGIAEAVCDVSTGGGHPPLWLTLDSE